VLLEFVSKVLQQPTHCSALLVQVAGVKRIIETTQGQSVYPADNQLLIYQGKILNLGRQLSYLLICALELYVHPFT